MEASDDVAVLLEDYRLTLLAMHDERIEAGGEPRRWNRLVDKMQTLHLHLAESQQGREGITSLALADANPTVRSWSAVNALAWDAASVRPLLDAEAADEASLNGLDAKMALREFDAGRLHTRWVPKRR
jgi:hypothetical protein